MIRTLFLILLLAGCQSTSLTDKSSDTVTIHRDQYGTPHVFAKTNYDVYYGYGYAVATDRLYQMEMLKRTVHGRVAEVLGKKYLELDTHIRTAYDLPSIKQQLEQLSEKDKSVLEGYANGFNLRIKEVLQDQQALLPLEFVENGFLPEQWAIYDVAMIFIGSIIHRYSDFNSELDNLNLVNRLVERHGQEKAWQIFNASKWLLDNDSPTTVARSRNIETPQFEFPEYLEPASASKKVAVDGKGEFQQVITSTDSTSAYWQSIAEHGFGVQPGFSGASNFWAVTSEKLLDANGALVNGPQFGWGVPSYVYGIGLHGGDFNVVGNTLLGLPSLLFAHNNYVGWGSTAGLSDQVDVYLERLNPNNPEQYLHNGKYHDFVSWDEHIKVKDNPDVIVKARRSTHGMVWQFNQQEMTAYTRARAWEGSELDTLMAWVNLAKTRNLDDFQQALSPVAANINFYYMDRQGSIGYTHGGKYPLRQPDHDTRLPRLGTGAGDWLGLRPYKDNPNTRNPQSGYLQNWNNRPSEDWYCSDLWTYTWSRGDRATLITKALEKKQKMTVDEVWQVNRDVSFKDVSWPFLKSHLAVAFAGRQVADSVVTSLNMLSAWDQNWIADNNGHFGAAPLIVETWLKELLAAVLKDDVGDELYHLYSATNNPSSGLGPSKGTPVGIKILIRNLDKLRSGEKLEYDFFNGINHQLVLVNTFVSTITSLTRKYGNDQSKWQLKAHAMQWKPYNFRGVPQAIESKVIEAATYMNRGSENNLFIANKNGFKAFDVIPSGQSGHINRVGEESEHYRDQFEMFKEYTYKPIPFSRDEVKQLSVSRQQIPLF